MKRLLIIDGHNLLFQMFFGFPVKLYNSKGKMVYNNDFKANKTYGGLVTDYNFPNLLVLQFYFLPFSPAV